jgi:hypothetical protein
MSTCPYRAQSIQGNVAVDFKHIAEAMAKKVADGLRKQGDDARTLEWIRLSTERARSGRFVELSDGQLKTIIDAVQHDDRRPRQLASCRH